VPISRLHLLNKMPRRIKITRQFFILPIAARHNASRPVAIEIENQVVTAMGERVEAGVQEGMVAPPACLAPRSGCIPRARRVTRLRGPGGAIAPVSFPSCR
jgi:hypothetical protein